MKCNSLLLSVAGYYGFVLLGWNVVLIPSLIRSIERDFGQSDAAFGLFYFVSALPYALGAFSSGLLTERVGLRPMLVFGATALALGLCGEAVAPVWSVLVLAAVVVNWGASAIDTASHGLFLNLHRAERGGALSLLHVFFSVGALVAPFAIGLSITRGVNWHVVLLASGVSLAPLIALFSLLAMPSGRHDAEAARTERNNPGQAQNSLLPFAGLAVSIALYVAATEGVSNWVVKLLAGVPVATATGVLSIFWAGLALGQLLANGIAERFNYYAFTVVCIVAASLALVAAVLAPSIAWTAALFALAGLFFGPGYPMIMALGGNLYPHRLSALSGGLTTAAVIGSLVYPPLMGIMAAHIGLRGGMIGAGLLGVPTALAIVAARAGSRHSQPTVDGENLSRDVARRV